MKKAFIPVCLMTVMSIGVYAQNSDALAEQQLNDVTIYASKTQALLKDLPNKIEVINKRQIDASGINNLTDLLKTYVNVDVIEYPGYNSYFSIRGFKPTEGKYTSILIDGVPAGTTNMATLSLGDVEQIEFLKGPFSSMYGSDAMGGVVNIVTKKNKGKLTGTAKVGVGSYQSAKGAFTVGGRVAGGLSFDASFDYSSQARNYKIGSHNILDMSATDKAIVGEDTYGIRMIGSTYNGLSGKVRVGYDFNPNWSLDFTHMLFAGKDLPQGGNVWASYGTKKKDVTRNNSKFELKGKAGIHNILFAPYYSTSRTQTYNINSDTAYVTTDSQLKTYGYTLNDNIQLGNHKIAFGLDSKNELNKLTSFSNRDVIKAAYKPNYRNSAMGVYVQSNLKFLDDKLNISLGARYDYIDFKLKRTPGLDNDPKKESYNIINPNIGFKYEMLKGLAFHSSFGTAFSMPDAYQKAGEYLYNGTITVGNPELKPEKSQTLDAGLSFSKPKQGIDLDVTYFYTWNQDFIVEELYTENGQKYKTFNNADKAKKSGIEVMASYDFGTLFERKFALKLYGNLTWMFLYDDYSNGVWNKTWSVRKQNANFGLDFLSNKGFSARLNGRFMGHRIEKNYIAATYRPDLKKLQEETQPDLVANSLIKHPEFLVFDFNASFPVTQKVSVGVVVNNILDENYTEKDGYNMPGRNFQLKASVSF